LALNNFVPKSLTGTDSSHWISNTD
jgi:hypothetical protein